MEAALKIISKINTTIINPLIAVLFGVALVVFLFGLFQYLWKSHKDPSAIQEGSKHIGWGLVGMFVMVSVFGFLQIIINSVPTDPTVKDNIKKVIPLN
ncbi:MAG: hypothetical protein RJB39_419 [Candidatus Parcubacteria bacterium]|jgi:hypothetical protein